MISEFLPQMNADKRRYLGSKPDVGRWALATGGMLTMEALLKADDEDFMDALERHQQQCENAQPFVK